MKLLILGHCSYFTIANFSDLLKRNISEIEITVADPFNPDGSELSEQQLKTFDEVISIPVKKSVSLKLKDKLNAIIILIRNKTEIRNILFNLLTLRLKKVNYYINSEAENKKYGDMITDILKKYDMFHFHYASPYFLYPIKYIPDNKVKLISIWGSDLFQTAGVKNYSDQLEAFEKADFIIINTIEKREIFLSKFGRHFLDKIRIANFGLPDCKFERMDKYKNPDTVIKFRKKYGIEGEKYLIGIGYNASSKQRHIEIIKTLNKLESRYKEKIQVFIPMTYGLQFESGDYFSKVKAACRDAGLDAVIFDKYMTEEEYFEYNTACDIKLNLRETDSMNAAMLESIYAGNIMVNGAWHPYGKLRRLGIYFKDIESIDELQILLPYIIDNYKSEKMKTEKNAEFVRSYFSSKITAVEWKKIFVEAINKYGKN